MLCIVISAAVLATTLAEQASCKVGEKCGGEESSALLQVARGACAMNGQDPYHNSNGQCCENVYQPMYKVKGKWYGENCSYMCTTCSTDGEDVYRYCGSQCGGCKPGGDALVPCCPGYTETLEGGRHICRAQASQKLGAVASGFCAGVDEDPNYRHNGQCCQRPSTPLYKIIGRWSGDYCSFQCQQCSQEGDDPFRFCGSECGGCERGGDVHVPCCPGLVEAQEGAQFVCRGPSVQDARKCAWHPQCGGLSGDCCPTSSGQFLDCCQSQCSSYPKCAWLGLTGNCCPSDQGVTLGCCTGN